MAVHIKNINGKDYAYEVISKWDKVKKKRYKQSTYLGPVTNPETKEYTPKKSHKVQVEKEILDYGDTYMLFECLKQSSIYTRFKMLLPKHQDTLKALLFYKIVRDGSFEQFNDWYKGNIASKIFPNASVDSHEISELLESLGNKRKQSAFVKAYVSSLTGSKNIVIDSTRLPNEINGNHDAVVDLETRLIMAIDLNTKNPLYFSLVTGNICNLSTLISTSSELKEYGLETEFILLDEAYYSDRNIRTLHEAKLDYLTRLSPVRKEFNQLIMQTATSLERPINAYSFNDRSLYIKREKFESCEYICYAYVCCDVYEKGKRMREFIRKAKDEKLSDEDFEEQSVGIGKFILVSSRELSCSEVLPLYYARQHAEQSIGLINNNLNITPHCTHIEKALKGYTFLCFLAVIITIEIKCKLKEFASLNNVLNKVRNIHCKVFDNKVVISGVQEYYDEIFEALSIEVPKQTEIKI